MAYKELYIAESIEDLHLIADPASKLRSISPKNYVEVLKSLYRQSLGEPFDQEKLYILLYRYIHVYQAYLMKEQDTNFVNLRFGVEYKKVLLNFLETRRILLSRYANKKEAMLKREQEKKAKVEPSTQPEEANKENTAIKPIFNSDYITCTQLYSALNKNILLVDARLESDFKESRIEHRNCINIPENCINKGLSANVLGQLLPAETKKIWDKRDSYDVIIIYDWGNNFDTFGTKVLDLRSAIVEWDPNRNYKEKPVILKGGYLELLQTYPSICSNPQVILSNKNKELDELIYLDYIVYPTENDSKTSIMGEMNFDEIVNEVTDSVQPGNLYEEFKNISKDRDELIDKMIDTKNSLRNFEESINMEMDYNKIRRLKNQEKKLKDEIDEMKKDLSNKTEKINQIKQEFDLCVKYGSRKEKNKNEEIVKEIVKKDLDNQKKLKILETMEDEFTRALQKARASKPRFTDNRTNEMSDDLLLKPGTSAGKPIVDRGTKPKLRVTAAPFVPLSSNSLGKVGLVNIKNTCYMNAGLQCFRNLPQIKALFCNDIYKNKYLLRQPPAIINELANLVRRLWTTASKSIEPTEFYRKICILEPGYSGGSHEDSMEFFLFMLNHLIEDCFYHMKQTNILTPKQKAWYNQFQGRCSVFAELFYHQIKIKQFCDGCNRHSTRFDIESTFMVPVPDGDFDIQDLMNQYMADYVIKEFCCSACKKPVINQKTISYAPSVLVILLKRYRQVVEGDTMSLYKSNCKGDFPINNLIIDNHRYELNSLIMHVGNLNFGHYTAACNIKNDGWYEFDDHMVKPLDITDDTVKTRACVYFYTLCD